jgi:hypothetical protein
MLYHGFYIIKKIKCGQVIKKTKVEEGDVTWGISYKVWYTKVGNFQVHMWVLNCIKDSKSGFVYKLEET